MVERERIVEIASRHKGNAGVLVTLVRVIGSSYRRPGARLMVAGGESAGTISGGCLEAGVVKRAAWAVRSGAVVERYSTVVEDAADVPYGLGCGGVVDLLMEPTGTLEFEAMLTALEGSRWATPTVITLLPEGKRSLLRAVLSAGKLVFCSEGLTAGTIDAALAGKIEDAFVETLAAPQRLIILGAGDDVRPLVRIANVLGWNVTVADGRTQLARPERFPEAQRVLAVAASDAGVLDIGADDAVVVMTHSYEQDRAWLAAALPVAPRYLGLLGARHRSSLLVREVSGETGLSVEDCCSRLFAPVGLDLGGDGPEAIALAVIAEAQACCMGRPASSRRLSLEDIPHDVSGPDVSQYAQAQCALEMRAG